MSLIQAHRIKTNPDPMEPFHIAQGYRVGNMAYLSGVAALTNSGEIVGEGDFDAQADQVFRNIDEVLKIVGSGLDQVIKVTIYLTDMGHFGKIVDLRAKWFTAPYPADTIVEVSALALPQLMIEIDVIALVDGEIIG